MGDTSCSLGSWCGDDNGGPPDPTNYVGRELRGQGDQGGGGKNLNCLEFLFRKLAHKLFYDLHLRKMGVIQGAWR